MGLVGVTIEITQADERAESELRELLSAANEAYRSCLPTELFEPYMTMVLDVASRWQQASALIAVEHETLVGTVTFFADVRDEGWGGEPNVSGVRAMAVHPSAQGRGVGTALLAACEERARAVGAQAISLHTASWLAPAIGLYERYGFRRNPSQDAPATRLMNIQAAADFVALAYRLDL